MSDQQPTPPPAPPASEAAPAGAGGPAAAVAAPPALPPAKEATQPSKPRPRLEALPPIKVLLHNDDVNDMAYVSRTVRALTGLPPAEARSIMLEAHSSGVALVLVTHLERAELYRDQFASKGLTATIEPAE